ncbi:hypothetical protein EJB05_51008, partial [Eragrostis curvula]
MHHQEPDRGFADLQVCEECSGVRIVKDDSGEECSGVRIVKDDSGVYQRPWFVKSAQDSIPSSIACFALFANAAHNAQSMNEELHDVSSVVIATVAFFKDLSA